MSAGQPHQSVRAVPPSVNGWNAEYLDDQYRAYLADPASLSPDLRQFFQGFDLAVARGAGAPSRAVGSVNGDATFQRAVQSLIDAYRTLGHMAAKIDPFDRPRPRPNALDAAGHGLTNADLSRPVDGSVIGLAGQVTLRDVMQRCDALYCGAIGFEYQHLSESKEREWFRSRIESGSHLAPLPRAQKIALLDQLTSAERFDKFLGVRYQGKKRFSLEGGESLIPLLKFLTQRAGELGTEEVIVGMPHRGRLSVLRNWIGKDLVQLFTEFEDSWTEAGSHVGGDVKYHRGYSGDQMLEDGSRSVHLSMLNNPSHLESVNGVVMGRCRARQDARGDSQRRKVISLLMHGDAAVAGQGVVAECLNMSLLEGYTVGGTIHLVVNNLVGFTTDPEDARSTPYCTDIAKIVNAPVLHVNADRPESVVHAARIAAEYRHEFAKDIFVDLVCFRRYGHNEQDEPGFTQPELYAHVKAHPGTPETYRRTLLGEGVVTQDQAQSLIDRYTTELDRAQTQARTQPVNPVPAPGQGVWSGFVGAYSYDSPPTNVSEAVIGEVCAALGRVPDGFNVHPRLKALIQARAELPRSRKLSHADAEMLAFGTLLAQGVPVRLTGQDSRRGTFTTRHAVLRDERTGERYVSINHIRNGQAQLAVYDSPLSEYSVMGFEYGYSRGAPRTLVLWEAQFGDFCNTAQVIIDQYMASSEAKWNRWAGLVLLLPHGYEGQGPEHSSARLERFLQLCAEDNMEVVYPSTGAQHFHALRRQALRNFRKPLVILTPKKFLRTETSTIDDLVTGSFQHLIDDPLMAGAAAKDVKTVIYCTGKFFHELAARRDQNGRRDVAIVRVEQLFPFHTRLARQINDRYPRSAARVWAQEEPRNMGAFLHMQDVFRQQLDVELAYIGRGAAASPATASEHAHHDQQDEVLTRAVGAAKQSNSVEKDSQQKTARR